MSNIQQENISFTLTKNEALILFDYLSDFNERVNSNDFVHKSDQIVLWNLEAVLESQLPEILDPNYQEIIAEIRETFES